MPEGGTRGPAGPGNGGRRVCWPGALDAEHVLAQPQRTVGDATQEEVIARIVEIHVPLVPSPGLTAGSYQFPWIEKIEDFLIGLEDQGEVEVYDEGEEYGDAYVFFITGTDEATLLAAASQAVTLAGVPTDAFAMITDEDAGELGMGQRVNLPIP